MRGKDDKNLRDKDGRTDGRMDGREWVVSGKDKSLRDNDGRTDGRTDLNDRTGREAKKLRREERE